MSLAAEEYSHRADHEFGDFLVTRGVITTEQSARLEKLGYAKGIQYAQMLLETGMLAEDKLAEAISEFSSLKKADDDQYPKEKITNISFNQNFLLAHFVLPTTLSDTELHLILFYPLSPDVIKSFANLSGRDITFSIGTFSNINRCLTELYDAHHHGETQENTSNTYDMIADEELLEDLAYGAPIIKTVNNLVSSAARKHASDIHIQPFKNSWSVRMRIDGELYVDDHTSITNPAAIVSRIKILAGLNIAERRLPQDGRFQIELDGRHIDIRVSILPEFHGERVVLRLLSQGNDLPTLDSTGFDEEGVKKLKKMFSSPHGLVLMAGPTGSGKTTTLYAALQELDPYKNNIMTVEDPIEYNIKGISQTQVKAAIGLSFSNTLRAMLRQDPDIVMVGEIRDSETASIAIHAALTGHLVLSTLHTNTAAGAIERLIDLGVDDFLIASALVGVISQRLMRKLCERCKETFQPSERTVEKIYTDLDIKIDKLWHAKGCDACHHTGYSGRVAIGEILAINNELKTAIMSGASGEELHETGLKTGMKPLLADGYKKVLAGVTSLDELSRFTGNEF